MLLLGLIYGVMIALEPYLSNQIFWEIELGPLLRILSIPYLATILILLVPAIVLLSYHRAKKITRIQWDNFLLIAVISTIFINYWGLIHVHVTFNLMCVAAFVFFVRGALDGRYDFVLLPVDLFLFTIFVLMVLSSYGPLGGPAETISNSSKFLFGMLLPVLYLHNAIRTRKQLMTAIRYLVYLSIVSSSIGILQFIAFKTVGIDITMNWNVELGRNVSLPILGNYLRVAGLTGNSNYLGFSTGAMTAFMTFLFLKPTYFSGRWRKILLVGILTGLSASLFSASRGSWLSLIVCYTIIPFVAYPKYTRHFIIAIFLFGSIGYLSGLFEYVYDAVYDVRPQAIYFRERLLLIGIDLIKNHPITGAGLDSFADYWNYHDAAVHNLWLNLATEIGILSPLVLLIYYLSLLSRLIRSAFRFSGFNQVVVQGLLITTIFFVVTSSVRPLLWDKFFWVFFGFIETTLYLFGRISVSSKVYYPVYGYSWRDEPSVPLETIQKRI
jgi:hypothetical protein